MEKKNVIVTGANGFIGSSLILKLIANHVYVVAIDVSFSSQRLPESEFLKKIESPVDLGLLEKIPQREYVALYHLAWRGVNGSEKADPEIQLSNIQMAIDCATICKKLGVKKYLVAGTIAERAVESLPELSKVSGGMLYGTAKHCAHLMLETYCKSIGQSFVWMQFSNIYGVGNKTGNLVSYTLGEILNGREATFGPALQPYDFIFADDLIEAVYRLGFTETTKTAYFIGSGTPKVLKDYLLLIGELADQRENIKTGIRPDDGIRYDFSMFDTTALREDIGDFVTTSFEEGIHKTIDWFRSTL